MNSLQSGMGMAVAEQENYKRRATDPPESPMIKKRKVLGDITNLESKITTKKKKKKKKTETRMHECNQPSSCSIYNHLHALEMEVNRRPVGDYAGTIQKEVSNRMREILVDWLVEVAEEFKLTSDTLYLAVSCIDRFLSIRPINGNQLQLVGVSSMLIASKHEEICPPYAEQFCFMTDSAYTVSEVMHMEREVRASLNFDLGYIYPTSKTFLRIIVRAAEKNFQLMLLYAVTSQQHSNQQLEFLASYLLELSLLDSKCIKFLPSLAAASALFLSKFIFQPSQHPWNPALQCQTGYKPCDLKECVLAIHALHSIIAVSPLQGVRGKYLQPKFTCVASLTAGKIPASYFEPIDE